MMLLTLLIIVLQCLHYNKLIKDNQILEKNETFEHENEQLLRRL